MAAETKGIGNLSQGEIVIGVIGYGYWGPNLCRNFLEIEGVRLKRICDSSGENLKKAGERCPGVDLTTSVEEILSDDEIQGVVIAAPAVTHYALSRDAMLAGKHVFVEKPMSLEVRQGRELVDMADESGLVLMVGHLLVHHPAVAYIKGFLESDGVGRIFYIYSQRLNLGRLRHDENCLWSLAPHDISVMLYLLESVPESVVARGASYVQDGLEDIVFCTLYFPEGRIGNVHVSWLDPHKVRRFTIVGSEKMLVFDDMSPDEKVKVYDKRVYGQKGMMGYGEELYLHIGDESVVAIEMEEPLKFECRHFRDCLMEGSRPISDGQQGLAVLKVLNAATRSLEGGGVPVEVE